MSGAEPGEGLAMDLGRPGVVWLDQEPVPVSLTGADRAVARLTKAQTATPLLEVGGRRRKDAAAAIDRWYRREARDRIGAVTSAEAARLGLEPEKITIRDQKTRWGSCSTSGTLSFNWRLVIGPGHALRYVVIHELVHIRHHNHSPAFWQALTEALPDWKRSATWLRANERTLTAYRPRI
jgi:predicted metal-dependent hydrolase